ncbi:hypothetical protein GCM10029963_39820 [Micromonospora andamanensis]
MTRWLTEAVPRGRVAAFRTLVYLFVAADLVFFTPGYATASTCPATSTNRSSSGAYCRCPPPPRRW